MRPSYSEKTDRADLDPEGQLLPSPRVRVRVLSRKKPMVTLSLLRLPPGIAIVIRSTARSSGFIFVRMQLIHESITQCSGLGGALCPGLQLRMLLRALANPDPAALLSVAMTIFNAYPILIKPDDTNFIVSVEFEETVIPRPPTNPPTPETCPARAEMLEIADQRLGHPSLTCRRAIRCWARHAGDAALRSEPAFRFGATSFAAMR
jgi:hypothetical protein